MSRKTIVLLRILGVWLLCFGFATAALQAQDRRVTGRVSDASGPLLGATVVVKGTTVGTVTDVNGDYSINVSGTDAVLVFSYTGYKTDEVSVGNQSVVNLTMSEEATLLEELVVTGYTVDTRKTTTGSVSTVKTKDLTAVPTGNVEQQLQGRAAGVTVITNGQPGTQSIIRVRGFGSFGGNEPLYIVDGLPVGSVDFLSPDDIESTTVLKDAAAASIYGARAASGVIVFTTKRGTKKPQKLSVSYDGLFGVTSPGKAQEVLNPQEHADWIWKALQNTGQPTQHPQYGNGSTPVLPDYINVGGASGVIGNVDLNAERSKYNVDPTTGPVYQVVRANKSGTDWWDAITRNAPMSRHSLGFTGATENSRYYIGLSLQDQAGILIHNDFRRYSLRANTEFDLNKYVRIGENMQITYRSVTGIAGGGGGRGIAESESNVLDAFRMPTIIPIYDEFGGYAGTAAKGFNNPRNPVAARDGSSNDKNFSTAVMGNIYAEIEPIQGLVYRTSFGGGYGNYYYNFYSRLQYENSENNGSFGYGEGSGWNAGWTFTNTIAYKKQFGASSIDLLAGIEALDDGRGGRSIDASGVNPFSTSIDFVTLSAVSNRQVNSSLRYGVKFYSQFGRVNYSFKDKYYVTGVIRRDGSSRFGSNAGFGVFPAFSAAWRVSGEEFMKGASFIDDLKIRGGWGQMGNSNNVDPNNQFSLFASNFDNSAFDINGSNTSAIAGFYKSRIGNPDAKWETSTTSNIGFDALFWEGKLDVIVDLWRKRTTDLLFAVPLPQVLGNYAAAPFRNVATMNNQGLDIQVVNKGKISSMVKYEVGITAAWLKNEIEEIAEGIDYFDGSLPTNRLGSNPVRNEVGFGLSSFYGYQVVGFFKDQAEVDAAPDQDGAGPGRFRFADLNGFDADGNLTGKPDGKIDAADRTIIGSPIPKFMGGLTLRFDIGNFDVSTYLYTSIGNKIFNLSKWYTDFYPSFTWASYSSRVKESWTPNNLDASTPIFENVSNFSTNTQANSWYVEDGSYLRMQNLSVGYTLPKNLLSRLGLQRLRLYASTNNVFTITKYKGLDPGVGGAADTSFGIDIGNYPVTRSYQFGVGITF